MNVAAAASPARSPGPAVPSPPGSRICGTAHGRTGRQRRSCPAGSRARRRARRTGKTGISPSEACSRALALHAPGQPAVPVSTVTSAGTAGGLQYDTSTCTYAWKTLRAGRHLPPAQAQPQRRQHPHRRLPVLIPAAPPWRAPATAGDPADSPRATAGSRHHRPASAGPLSARCHRCPGERETGFAVFTGPAHPGGECHTCARRLGPNGVIE